MVKNIFKLLYAALVFAVFCFAAWNILYVPKVEKGQIWIYESFSDNPFMEVEVDTFKNFFYLNILKFYEIFTKR